MAKFVIKAALGYQGDPGLFLDENTMNPVAKSGTSITYKDAEGEGFKMTGTGFTFSRGEPVAGVVTSMEFFNSAGLTQVNVTRLSASLADLSHTFGASGYYAAFALLAQGDDTFIGSAISDYLIFAGKGNDTIQGNDGNDFIRGGAGRDVLNGGNGQDTFVFFKGDGKDTITDFKDTGGLSDDMIALAPGLREKMVVVETADGVELHFGAKDMITVLGWTAAQVGSGDFTLA